MSNLKVSILLPDFRAGGAERVNINLANEFVARGYAVDMVVMQAIGDLMPLLDPRIRVINLGAARMRGVLRPLARYLREMQPTSLLACMWPLTFIAALARLVARVDTRLVVAEHSTWSAVGWYANARNRFILAASTYWAYRRADAVVTVSLGAAHDMARIARLPSERVTAIYNPIVGGVKTPASQPLPDPSRWQSGAHQKILAVGTLKEIKDYATLLRAFARLRNTTNAKLLILGEGEERNALERLIGELGIDDDVFLPGFASSTERYYRTADLFVLSSVGEGLPTVIVEALEQGTPVVSTDCRSGPREILDNGRYGALVPVGDPEALANSMKHALESPHDKEALKARAADFSVNKAADAYLDLLLPDWREYAAQKQASY